MNFLRFSSLLAWIFVWAAAASVRASYDVEVTGSTSGSVWGSGPYTNDSSLGAAAVHSGILQPGQTGTVRVHTLPGQSSYAGSTANGVTTMSYGAWGGSISLELLGLAGGGGGGGANQPPAAWLSQVPGAARTAEVMTVKGKASDPENRLHWMTIRWLNHGVQGDWSLGGTTGEQERTTTITAPASPDTMYVRAESSDQDGAATAGPWHTISVTVPPNSPTVYAGVPDWMLVGETKTISVSAQDADGDIDTVYIEQQGVSTHPLHRSVSGGDVFQVGSITAPSTPQTINLRAGAIDSGGHTVVTAWRAVQVLAAPPASIAVSPASLSLGALLTVSYGNAPAGAHLRLHAMGASDSTYLASTTVAAAGSGSVPMQIGSGFAAGQSYQARLFASNGTTLLASSTAFAVTASPSNDYYEADVVGALSGGSVWGTDVYTDDSHLGIIAVHTGLLVNGQAGRLRVFRLAGLGSYAGSSRHGVTTFSSSAYPRSIRVELISTGAVAYDPTVQIHLPAAPAQVMAGETFLAYASVADGNGDLRRSALLWDGTPLIDRPYTSGFADDLAVYATAGSALGVRTLRAWASDSRNPAGTANSPGYGAAEAPVNVIGPNAAPLIAGMTATVNALIPAEVSLQAQATDADGDLRTVSFYIAEPPAYNGMFLVGTANVAGGSATASFVWRPAQLTPGGVYRLLAVSRDAVGASSTGTAYAEFTVPAGAYTLTVENGSGGGAGLLNGTVRTITANPPVSGQVFVNWTVVSGAGTFANAAAATTTFTMGAGNAVIRANYSAAPPDYVIDTNRTNFNLAAALGNPTVPRTFTVAINAGVVIGSAIASSPAFTTGDLPAGSSVKITNLGRIQGAGGAGGRAGDGYADGHGGFAGGDALAMTVPTTIDNTHGQIWGGGGGGGGSGGYWNNNGTTTGSGGGGGAGTEAGAGGAIVEGVTYSQTGNPGNVGTWTTGGAGGSSNPWFHNGGAGGSPGEPGGDGSTGNVGYGVNEGGDYTYGGPGGSAGRAVNLNGHALGWIGGMSAPNVRGGSGGMLIDTQPPSVPSGLAIVESDSSATMTWNPSTDNNGVTGYEVMRDAIALPMVSNTSIQITGTTAQTTYELKVRARDASGNWSAWSSSLSYTATQTTAHVDLVLSVSRHNVNLAAELAYPSVARLYTVTIRPGVVIGSTNTNSPAFTTGPLPSGSTVLIVNSGRIQGAGGLGGLAGDGEYPGAVGGAGGDALFLTVPTSVDNTAGEIWGGGGGGGGSGGYSNQDGSTTGSGGGGGSGTVAGEGGAKRTNVNYTVTGEPGAAGTGTAGGAGGETGWNHVGGTGGNPGEPGGGGSEGCTWYLDENNYYTGGGSGGAPGWAVRLNGHALTWLGGMSSPNVKGSSGGTVATPPVITTHPASQTKLVGQTVSLTVTVSGSAPLVYQWRKNGADIAGAAAATMTLANLHLTDAGSYTVRVVNGVGSVTSNAAVLTVTNAADTDTDGIPDAWETQYGLNPNSASDALLDPDGDGLTNVAEYNLGRVPNAYNAGTSTLGGAIPVGWPNLADPANSAAIGFTRGEFAVDKNGAATYSIPLWVSPGTAGMEPKLSLNYSSQAGAGLAGFGWSVGGISSITRGGPTLAQEGRTGGVTFTLADRYYLDGQRLVAINGADGGADTEYRTEVDTFSRIRSYGAAGGGPATFRVWTKSGLIVDYGTTPASAFNPGNRTEVLTWAVAKISDTKGNSMRFDYTEDPVTGEHRIAAIRYTERATNDFYASVIFDYEPRGDTSSGFIAGSPLAQTQRLKRIRSCYSATPGVDGPAVRTYELTYTERPVTLRSLLTQVEEIASDGRKYPPLVFAYEEPTQGWTTAATLAPPVPLAQDGAPPRGTGFIDLDGDGRPDFVRYHRWGTTNVERDAWLQRNGAWELADGSVAGVPDWRLPATQPDALTDNQLPVLAWDGFADFGTRFIDFDRDGLVDVLHGLRRSDGTTHSAAYRNNGAGWTRATTWDLPAGAYLAAENDGRGSARLLDLNGDGLVDIVWRYSAAIKGAALNTGSGWQLQPAYAPEIDIDGSVLFLDVTGDGLPDQLQHWYGGGNTVRGVALNTGTGWQALAAGSSDFNRYVPPFPITVRSPDGGDYSPVGAEVVDLNGDGLADLAWNNPAATSTPPGGYTGAWFNTGAGWQSAPAVYLPKFKLMDNNTAVGSALIDVNGDGIADQVVSKESNPGGEAGVYLGTGRGWADKLTASPLALPHYVSRFDTTKPAAMDFVDLDGDGATDQVWHRSGGAAGASRNGAKAADRLRTVTNGLGVAATVTYAPLTERDAAGAATVYERSSTPAADTAHVIGPMPVVKTVTHDDGAGGQYPVNYFYTGLRSHRVRGSLGFASMRVTDGRTQITATTNFSQEFPTIGQPIGSITRSGSTNLSESVVTYAARTLHAGKVHFAVAASTLSTTREPGMANTTHVTQTDTYIPVPATDVDDTGNVKKLIVDSGGGWMKTTENVYADDPTNWFLGRLVRSTVTAAAPGTPPLTRTSGFRYDAVSGLLTDEAVEPVFDDPVAGRLYASDTDLAGYGVQTLRTRYAYDAYGNRTEVHVSGLRVQVATDGTVTSAGTLETRSTTLTYHAGRLPASKTNAANHTETYTVYDHALGLLKELKGPNGLVTSWLYDSFGQKTRETRADTTITDVRVKWAPPGGTGVPAGAKYFVETESTGTAPALVFHDRFGRAIRALALNGAGEIVLSDTHYDPQGRAHRQSNPYRNDGQPVWWTQTMSYDVLNRPLTVRTPDDERTTGYVESHFDYQGLVTSAVDAKGRVTETTRNAAGWVTGTIRNRAAGAAALDYAATSYAHDAFGNIVRTTAGGVETTLVYDVRGRKTTMTDPAMGQWRYAYNPFGELVWQKDAKSQISTLAYDTLGRLVTRTEAEGMTTWTYDSAPHAGAPSGAPATWVGLLGSVTSPGGYEETHTYDTFGRPSSVARTIDSTTYALGQTYDAAGRPEKTEYPTVNGGRFATRHVYNALGFLKEIRSHLVSDDGKPVGQLQGKLWWQADSFDAAGRINGELLGNGLAQDRVYSAATGRLIMASIDAGRVTAPPYALQQLVYTHDEVGNVRTRADQALGRGESFDYDGLDRLRTHTVVTGFGGTVTVGYDARGNITQKSDAGTYTYHPTKKYAVTGISGGPLGAQTYSYDDNGNMTSGGGRSLDWTSFNQPWRITKGSHSSTFSFGAARERVKQVSHLETTIYVGALFEKVTPVAGGAPVEYKHYIASPTGRVAVYTDRSNLVKDTKFFHTDGLGSITAVSDERGQIVKRFAFDAWGRRLDPANGATITGATAAGLRRGFTDHEHLDDLSIVHMNGRVYDPVLGRFLSADPFVGDAGDSQEYNRYSYLGNNPLGGTDPSGYFSLKDGLKIAAAVVVGVLTAGVALYGYAAVMGGSFAGGFAGALSSVGLAAGWGGGWAVAAGAGFGFGSSFAASLLNGGSIGDAFKAGAIGGVVGGVAAGIAGKIGDFAETKSWFRGAGQNLAHGVAQGGLTEATGGEFRHGFYAGFASSSAGGLIGDSVPGGVGGQTVAAAVVGGTASAVGGGKFANGAVSAAFTYLFNHAAHQKGNYEAYYLVDVDSVGGNGHVAVLLVNAAGHVTYASFAPNSPVSTKDNLDIQIYRDLPAARAELSKLRLANLGPKSEYDKYVKFNINKTQYGRAMHQIYSGGKGTLYFLKGFNCDDFAQTVFEAAGIKLDGGFTPNRTLKAIDPNKKGGESW